MLQTDCCGGIFWPSDNCCICLKEMKEDNTLKNLSCGHKLHFNCYKEYIKTKNQKHFVQCPLCRKLNSDISIPGETSYEKLENICGKRERCKATTKNGLRCKNKSCLLNYGYCNIHNKKTIVDDKYYDMIFRFVNHYWGVFSQGNWKTRVILIDIAIKLTIKLDLKDFDKFLYHLFKCSEEQKLKYTEQEVRNNEKYIYEYYDLELPPDEWLGICLREKKIF